MLAKVGVLGKMSTGRSCRLAAPEHLRYFTAIIGMMLYKQFVEACDEYLEDFTQSTALLPLC